MICSTNAIKSVNARYRRAIRFLGHFRYWRRGDGAAIGRAGIAR